MRIGFMGTPDFASRILHTLFDANKDIAFVVTQPDRPKGRSGELAASPVKQLATLYKVPVLQPARVREPAAIAQIAAFAPEILIVAAFGQILPKELLQLPKYGCVNVHASLLPAYRGAAPIQRALLAGEKVTGVTIMQMDEGLDTGDMLAKVEVPIAENETGGSLFDKLSVAGASLLLATLPMIEQGELRPEAQPGESPTPYASMLKKEDGRLCWQKSAAELERQIRALSPWPGSYTALGGKGFRVCAAEAVPDGEVTADLPEMPGAFVIRGQEAMLVRTGQGVLSLKEVQLAGKKKMGIAEFLRGYHGSFRAFEAGIA